MSMRGVLAISALFLLVVLALPAAAGAGPGSVACGDEIVADTTLQNDLVGCPTTGLILNAAGITLDLNGHTITGAAGASTGLNLAWPDPGGPPITVKGGRVSGFAQGVSAQDGPSFGLQSMEVVENGVGLWVVGFGGTPMTIASSLIERNAGEGILVAFYFPTVTDSRIRRNGAEGIHAIEALPGRYEHNDISDNGGTGLYLENSVGSMINNHFDRNGGAGMRLAALDFPDPLSASFAKGNQAMHNAGLGFSILSLPPWEGFDGGGNVAKGNGDPRQCVVETVTWDTYPPIPHEALVCRTKG
jgi:hypothetical protein